MRSLGAENRLIYVCRQLANPLILLTVVISYYRRFRGALLWLAFAHAAPVAPQSIFKSAMELRSSQDSAAPVEPWTRTPGRLAWTKATTMG